MLDLDADILLGDRITKGTPPEKLYRARHSGLRELMTEGAGPCPKSAMRFA